MIQKNKEKAKIYLKQIIEQRTGRLSKRSTHHITNRIIMPVIKNDIVCGAESGVVQKLDVWNADRG
jgi:hypothetical protein